MKKTIFYFGLILFTTILFDFVSCKNQVGGNVNEPEITAEEQNANDDAADKQTGSVTIPIPQDLLDLLFGKNNGEREIPLSETYTYSLTVKAKSFPYSNDDIASYSENPISRDIKSVTLNNIPVGEQFYVHVLIDGVELEPENVDYPKHKFIEGLSLLKTIPYGQNSTTVTVKLSKHESTDCCFVNYKAQKDGETITGLEVRTNDFMKKVFCGELYSPEEIKVYNPIAQCVLDSQGLRYVYYDEVGNRNMDLMECYNGGNDHISIVSVLYDQPLDKYYVIGKYYYDDGSEINCKFYFKNFKLGVGTLDFSPNNSITLYEIVEPKPENGPTLDVKLTATVYNDTIYYAYTKFYRDEAGLNFDKDITLTVETMETNGTVKNNYIKELLHGAINELQGKYAEVSDMIYQGGKLYLLVGNIKSAGNEIYKAGTLVQIDASSMTVDNQTPIEAPVSTVLAEPGIPYKLNGENHNAEPYEVSGLYYNESMVGEPLKFISILPGYLFFTSYYYYYDLISLHPENLKDEDENSVTTPCISGIPVVCEVNLDSFIAGVLIYYDKSPDSYKFQKGYYDTYTTNLTSSDDRTYLDKDSRPITEYSYQVYTKY